MMHLVQLLCVVGLSVITYYCIKKYQQSKLVTVAIIMDDEIRPLLIKGLDVCNIDHESKTLDKLGIDLNLSVEELHEQIVSLTVVTDEELVAKITLLYKNYGSGKKKEHDILTWLFNIIETDWNVKKRAIKNLEVFKQNVLGTNYLNEYSFSVVVSYSHTIWLVKCVVANNCVTDYYICQMYDYGVFE